MPKAPDAPNGVFHTFHYGADTALWNVKLAHGTARAPATGQAVAVDLEGCARAVPGGPAPLTQIHFQDISPLPGGGARVNLTSQAFAIPVCGSHGTSAATISTYRPINLCVSRGDYVAFNDEGGYVENVYRSGVPYRVLGRARGSTTDSFLRDNGTGNGALLSPSLRSPNEGFVANRGEELMLRVRLGTGPDATHICPGGTSKRRRVALAQPAHRPPPSSCSSVWPLSTDSALSATTSEPGRASSSRRLISSHCGLAPVARALQREAAAQLLAVQHEHRVPALERLRPGDAPALLVAAAIPDDHAAVLGRALEAVVRDRVVLDLHRQALDRRVQRRALRHAPTSASRRRPPGAGRSGAPSRRAPARRTRRR